MKKTYILIAFFAMLCFSSFATDWTKVTTQLTSEKDYTFLKIDESICYAFVLTGNSPNFIPKVLKTTNGGTTWDSVATTGLVLGSSLYKAVAKGTTLYIVGGEGLYKSTNNASTWTLVSNPDITGIYKPNDILVDGSTIYVSTPAHGLYSTTDDFANLGSVGYNLASAGTNCVAKANGRLYTSTTGNAWYLNGTTWVACTGLSTSGKYIQRIAYANSLYYLSDNNSGLYSSTDGIAWTLITNTGNPYLYDFAIANNYLLATQSDYKFIYTNNTTINNSSTGLPMLLAGMGLVVLGNNAFIGGYSPSPNESGIYTRPLSSIVPTGIQENTKDLTISIFPNPVANTLNIKQDKEIQKLSIINACGKTIINKNVYSSEVQLNIGDLSTGVYFIQLQSDNSVSTHKFVKQ